MDNISKIQCLECKEYFGLINYLHLEKCCGLTTKEYREKYPNAIMVKHSINTRLSMSKNHSDVSGERNPMYDKSHLEKSKQKISDKNKGKAQGKNSSSYKYVPIEGIINLAKQGFTQRMINQKLGISSFIIRSRLKEYNLTWWEVSTFNQHTIPNHNPDACKFFEEENIKRDYVGQHAENGGEKRIFRYFVDNYSNEKLKPTIIEEFDEPYHFDKDGRLKEKDRKRMQNILNSENAIFNRYYKDKITGEIILYFKYFPGLHINGIEKVPTHYTEMNVRTKKVRFSTIKGLI